jgi:hypothetical protein
VIAKQCYRERVTFVLIELISEVKINHSRYHSKYWQLGDFATDTESYMEYKLIFTIKKRLQQLDHAERVVCLLM